MKRSTKDLVSGGSEPEERAPRAKREKKSRGAKASREPRSGKPVSRILIGTLCVIAALFVAFGLTPLMNQLTTEEVTAIKLIADVTKGTPLQSDMFRTVQVNNKNLPSDMLHEMSDITGQYAAADLMIGDIMTSRKMTAALQYDDPYLSNLPQDKLAISVTMQSIAESVSGKLRAGDIVRLFYYPNDAVDKSDYSARSLPELQYVEVLAATNTRLRDLDTKNDGLIDAENEEKTISTLTLAVNDQQAAALVGLNQVARLHAALVTRGDEAYKQAVLTAQNDYFQGLLPTEVSDTESETSTAVSTVMTTE